MFYLTWWVWIPAQPCPDVFDAYALIYMQLYVTHSRGRFFEWGFLHPLALGTSFCLFLSALRRWQSFRCCGGEAGDALAGNKISTSGCVNEVVSRVRDGSTGHGQYVASSSVQWSFPVPNNLQTRYCTSTAFVSPARVAFHTSLPWAEISDSWYQTATLGVGVRRSTN